jgi:WD40 repeat protein
MAEATGGSVQAPTPAAIACPQATPELLRVEAVTSPTDEYSQVVTVYIGNAEAVTVTSESGVFTGLGYPARVEVILHPDTVHHLEVVAKVREMQRSDGCVYGGYSLRTRRDQHGSPLVIEQGQPQALVPGVSISPETALRLEPLHAIAPEVRLTTDFAYRGSNELVSVGYADKISQWSVVTGQEIGRIGHSSGEAAAISVDVSPDGSLVATGGTANDPSVRVWDVAGEDKVDLGKHGSYVESIAFSPSGARLASGDNQNTVNVWDVSSGEQLLSLKGDFPKIQESFHTLHWSDDETLIGAGSDTIYWWEVTTGRVLNRLARPEDAAFFVDATFRQDGHRIAAVAQDNAVYFWDRGSDKWSTWRAPEGASLAHVEFSPDGKLLASASYEGDLLLWDVEAQELLPVIPVTTAQIAAVRFSPDQKYLAVGGWDSVIWLWGVPSK